MVAINPIKGMEQLKVAGFQQLTVSTAALALTIPTGTLFIVLILDPTNGLRYRDDGTDPTATVGMPIAGGGVAYVDAPSISKLKLIRSGASDAIVNATYYGV